MQKKWKCILLVSFAIALSACGGGKSADSGSSAIVEKMAIPSAELLKANNTIVDGDGNAYLIDSDGSLPSVSLKPLNQGDRATLSVVSEGGEVLGIKIRTALDDSTIVNTESTALAFVLMHPALHIANFADSDLENLKNQIRKIEIFKILKSQIDLAVSKGAACPVSHECMQMESNMAFDIVKLLDFSEIKGRE